MTKKIGFVSDVHLEFGHLDLNNKDNLDILILAGDISTPHAWKWNHNSSARKTKDIQMKFFKNIADQFPKVIYIPGNHEHYHGDYMDTEKLLQTNLAQFPNIQVGNHLVHEDNDFVIIGDTLWTDFDNNNSITMLKSQVGMNDFRLIYLDRSFLNPRDVFVIHRTALANIANDIARFPDKKIIVVSHHLPSFQVISKGFRDDALNGAYASNLDQFMNDHNVHTWIHGHSHPPADQMVGNTRVVRHPRGYVNHEKVDPNYTYKVIEI